MHKVDQDLCNLWQHLHCHCFFVLSLQVFFGTAAEKEGKCQGK